MHGRLLTISYHTIQLDIPSELSKGQSLVWWNSCQSVELIDHELIQCSMVVLEYVQIWTPFFRKNLHSKCYPILEIGQFLLPCSRNCIAWILSNGGW